MTNQVISGESQSNSGPLFAMDDDQSGEEEPDVL